MNKTCENTRNVNIKQNKFRCPKNFSGVPKNFWRALINFFGTLKNFSSVLKNFPFQTYIINTNTRILIN
jgi:hypothetical protein